VVVDFSPAAAAPTEGSAVELRSSKRIFPQVIERVSSAGGVAVIAFRDVRTISEALRLVGCSLWSEAPEAGQEAPGGFLGFRVFDRQGECWGIVRSQSHFSLNQVLEIEDEASGEIVLVPWHDSLVVAIDPRVGTLVIDPPAGLRELNR
jgi:RimM protein, required for 16S rRNA processing